MSARKKTSEREKNAPAGAVITGGGGKLDLNTVYAVDAVDEEDEDEYERYLHPILYFGNKRIFGKETKAKVRGQRSREVTAGSRWRRTYVKILRFTVKGNGTIRTTNKPISAMSNMNT